MTTLKDLIHDTIVEYLTASTELDDIDAQELTEEICDVVGDFIDLQLS